MRQHSQGANPSSRAGGVTFRPVASPEELIRLHQVISAQFPPRRGAPAHGLEALIERYPEDQRLMLLAETGGRCLGGALAFRVEGAVKVDAIALEPEVRGMGIGRLLMEAIEREAIELGARGLYLGGANTENRGFYWRLGFAGRRSLMQKALPARRPTSKRGLQLPGRPNIEQLKHQAKDLLRAATSGDPEAVRRIQAVSDQVNLSGAQLAVARRLGFPSWPKLRLEIARRGGSGPTR